MSLAQLSKILIAPLSASYAIHYNNKSVRGWEKSRSLQNLKLVTACNLLLRTWLKYTNFPMKSSFSLSLSPEPQSSSYNKFYINWNLSNQHVVRYEHFFRSFAVIWIRWYACTRRSEKRFSQHQQQQSSIYIGEYRTVL